MALPAASAQETPDRFSTITPAELRKEIDATWDGDVHTEMIQRAFGSGRLDLIWICRECGRTSVYFYPKLRELPESPLKDEILLMLIRRDSFLWIFPGELRLGPRGFSPTVGDPFDSFISKHFPGHPMIQYQPFSQEDRNRLADQLEAAVAAEHGYPTPPSRLAAAAGPPLPVAAGGANPVAQTVGRPDPPVPSNVAKESTSRSVAWLATGVVLALAVCLILAKRRHGSNP